MTNSINGLEGLSRALLPAGNSVTAFGKSSQPAGLDFQSMLLQTLDQTNKAEGQAGQAIGQFQIGGETTKPEVFIAIRKAELALRMTMQIRNKILEAYEEIQQMRM